MTTTGAEERVCVRVHVCASHHVPSLFLSVSLIASDYDCVCVWVCVWGGYACSVCVYVRDREDVFQIKL